MHGYTVIGSAHYKNDYLQIIVLPAAVSLTRRLAASVIDPRRTLLYIIMYCVRFEIFSSSRRRRRRGTKRSFLNAVLNTGVRVTRPGTRGIGRLYESSYT